MGSFILFILWLVGLIVISIQLWGPVGSVNGNCQLYVVNQKGASEGPNGNALAWLEQSSICKFSFYPSLCFCGGWRLRGVLRERRVREGESDICE